MFFCFTEYDKNLDPDREDMRSRAFESFYNREPLYDRSGYLSNPVKEILYNYYHKANCESNIKNIEDIKERLLTKFRQTPIEDMDEHLKDSIADILYDKSYFCSDFACIVTKDNNIYNYSYYLVHKFEEWDTGEEIVIEVLEKEKGSFLKDILPILKEKFNDRIEKVIKLE